MNIFFLVPIAAITVCGCSKAQIAKIETGIPIDMQTIGCVISAAIATDMNLVAVAGSCYTDIAAAAEILIEAATMPSSVPAKASLTKTDAMLAATARVVRLQDRPALKDAMAWKASH